MSGILKRIATIFVALAIAYLLGDIFSGLPIELIWIGITIVLAIPVICLVAIDLLRTLFEYLVNCSLLKKLFLAALWQGSQWVYDNPVWIDAQILYGAWGVVMVMIGAVLMNYWALSVSRNDDTSWTLWEDGVTMLKKSYLKLVIVLSIVLYADSVIGFVFLVSVLGIIFCIIKKIIFQNRMREDIFMFFFLSFYQDSFIVTTYLRHGRKGGLNQRDMRIFAASSIVSIIYWAVRNTLVLELLIRPLLK